MNSTHSKHSKQDEALSRKSLRRALCSWRNVRQLGKYPLAKLEIVQAQLKEAHYPENEWGWGMAIRDVLSQTIEFLRPKDGQPNYGAKKWRAYLLLTEQFIQGYNPTQVSDKLGVATSTYHHAEASALDTLGNLLWEQEQKHGMLLSSKLKANEQRNIPFLAPPRPPYPLVGRITLLDQVKKQLIEGHSQALLALRGLPGVGKTALAVELANDDEVLSHFSDGVLWASLGQQADVMALLREWGIALKIPHVELARSNNMIKRTEAVHRAIGLRRMLVIVDDAWEADAALTFRLGGPYCAHLVTTRLPEVAVHFAPQGITQVSELSIEEGIQLFDQFMPHGLELKPGLVRQLVIMVGSLPLGLVLLANHLHVESYSPDFQPEAIIEKLRLAELRLQLTQPSAPLTTSPTSGGDVSLAAVINVSVMALSLESQQMLAVIAIFPAKPNTFTRQIAMKLSGLPERAFDQLIERGLIELGLGGRYALHQVITDYARINLVNPSMYEQMVLFYVDYVTTHREEGELLRQESQNIAAAWDIAFERQLYRLLIDGVLAFYPFWETQGAYTTARLYLEKARQAATAIEDTKGTLQALGFLGQVMVDLGVYDEAKYFYQKGLELARQIDDQDSKSQMLQGLGLVADHHGQYQEAEALYQESLKVARELDLPHRISTLLMNLGGLARDRGDERQAEKYLQEGLVLARMYGYYDNLSPILLNLGTIAANQGDYDQERAFYEEGLVIARAIGHRENISYLLANLSAVTRDLGECDKAEAYATEGLEIARQIGHRERISSLLRHLGELAEMSGKWEDGETFLQDSLTIAREMNHRRNIAAALIVFGDLMIKQTSYERAEVYLQEALYLARGLGHSYHLCDALNKWGKLKLELQQLDLAHNAFSEALELTHKEGIQDLKANALFGLAQIAAARGNLGEAYRLGKESLSILEKIRHIQATIVKEWLDSLPSLS